MTVRYVKYDTGSIGEVEAEDSDNYGTTMFVSWIQADRLVAAGHLRGCKGTHGLGVFCTVAPEDQTEANGYVTR